MNEFKLDDGTMGKILYIYHNYLLYTKDNDNNIFAAKYEIINKMSVNYKLDECIPGLSKEQCIWEFEHIDYKKIDK